MKKTATQRDGCLAVHRFAGEHPRHLFPYLPKQPGYNKRLRRLGATLNWLIGAGPRHQGVDRRRVGGRLDASGSCAIP